MQILFQHLLELVPGSELTQTALAEGERSYYFGVNLHNLFPVSVVSG